MVWLHVVLNSLLKMQLYAKESLLNSLEGIVRAPIPYVRIGMHFDLNKFKTTL